LCVPGENNGPQCLCPSGLSLLNDRRTCGSSPACDEENFACKTATSSDKDCIPKNWVCDGQVDCVDGSDEIDCPECRHDQFQCKNGPCIGKNLQNTALKVANKYLCCADLLWRCDGTPQCPDGLDELNCCPKDQFRCASSLTCIASSMVCDGWNNCADGSDESPMSCVHRRQEVILDFQL
jgi:low density lipoprotein receptor-related protein 5/6